MIKNVTPCGSQSIICEVCKKVVSNLKPNCHIIPKWSLKYIKIDGWVKQFDISKVSDSQYNPTTESWCAECEKNFSKLDGFGYRYFVDKKINIVSVPYKNVVFEKLSDNDYQKLSEFIVSIFARYYLYKKNEKIAYKEYYKKIFKSYCVGRMALVSIEKYSILEDTISVPKISNLVNYSHKHGIFYFLGYCFSIYVKKSKMPSYDLIFWQHRHIKVFSNYKNRFSEDFLDQIGLSSKNST